MRVFVSSMLGAGNLGDDLIAYALCTSAIAEVRPDSLAWLHHGVETDVTKQIEALGAYTVRPSGPRLGRLRADRHALEAARASDLFLLGGGGLLQDTHYGYTPYKWLRWAFMASSTYRAAVGLGLGPIRLSANRHLIAKALASFDTVQVRDVGSQSLAAALGVSSQVSGDIVESGRLPFIAPKPAERDLGHTRTSVGFSFRPWPGLQLRAAIKSVGLARASGFGVNLYVFENAPDDRSELEFAQAVADGSSRSGPPIRILTYGLDPTHELLMSVAGDRIGVGCRFHANILWSRFGVPVLPISYAPKTAGIGNQSMPPRSFTTWIDAIPDWPSVERRARYRTPTPWAFPSFVADPRRGPVEPAVRAGLAYGGVEMLGERVVRKVRQRGETVLKRVGP